MLKNQAASDIDAGDSGSVPGSGRPSGGGNGNRSEEHTSELQSPR